MSGTYSKLRKKAKQEKPKEPTPVAPVRVEPPEALKSVETKRVRIRKSYDVYIDQVKALSTQTKMYFLLKGEDKGITQMIREAIDEYIEKYQ